MVWLQFSPDTSTIDAGTACALHSSGLAFSTQDRESGDFAGIKYWEFSSGETGGLDVKSMNDPGSLKISPDGRHLLMCSTDEIEIVGLEPGRCYSQVYLEGMSSSSSAYWLDNSRIVYAHACSYNANNQLASSLNLWDLGSMSYKPIEIATVQGTLSHPSVLDVNDNIIVTGDSVIRDAALSATSLLQIKLWDVRTGASIRSLRVPHKVFPDPDPEEESWPVCCLDADNRIAFVHFHGQLHVFDIGTGLMIHTNDGVYKTIRRSFAVNRAGTAAVGRGGKNTEEEEGEEEGVVVWDLAQRQHRLALDNPFGQNYKHCGMATSPDLDTVAMIAKDPHGIVSAHIWSS